MKNLLQKLLSILIIFGFMQACNEPLVEEEAMGEIHLKSTAESHSPISQIVEDRYIVVFKGHVINPKAEVEGLAHRFGLTPGHVYEHAVNGFSAYIPGNAIQGLRNNPNIERIEPDITMKAFGQTIPTGISRIQAVSSGGDNVDVDVAVVDTGVDDDHEDLNVVGGVRFYTPTTGPPHRRETTSDNNYDDDNGHGTHVAGTIAAYNNSVGVVGIAPGARIWAVKVLNAQGSGYLSDIIAGLNWVAGKASDIEVLNMSLGGQGFSQTYHDAVKSCVDAGVVVVVAAGNESMDVYGQDGEFGTSDDIIPAAYPEAAAISALADSDGTPGGLGESTNYGTDDSFASFSNFSDNVVSDNPVTSPGKAIDLILPGVDILSTYLNGQYAWSSGTSMASPHAAGLAALYVADNGRATNAEGVYTIRQALIDGGVAQSSASGLDTLNDPDGNEENLGWVGNTVENQSPVADFTYTTSGLTATFTDQSSDPDGTVDSWSWDFEDGANSSEKSPAHTYSSAGTYTVTLTVTDDDGATNTTSKNVTVESSAGDNAPDVVFSITDTSNPAWKRVSVNWNASDTDGDLNAVVTELIDPGNNSVATSTSDVSGNSASGTHDLGVKGGQSGTYTVVITVTDAAGNTTTKSDTKDL